MRSRLQVGPEEHLALMLLRWAIGQFRPRQGWTAFMLMLGLLLLSAQALRIGNWVNFGRSGVVPEWVLVIGLSVSWFLRGRWQIQNQSTWRRVVMMASWLLAGALTVTQVLVHWLPTLSAVWQAWRHDAWRALYAQGAGRLADLGWRTAAWVRGVWDGGALQDDLIFLLLVCLILWLLASLSAWLVQEGGLRAALPALWSLCALLYYGNGGRVLLGVGLLLTMVLHLWLDHQRLERSWSESSTDYSPLLIVDRLGIAAGFSVLILVVALVAPSLSLRSIDQWSSRQMAPLYDGVESLVDRLFPDLESAVGRGGRRLQDGLPNRSLIGSAPDLAEIPVMWVKTNLSGGRPDEPPPRIYLRSGTFAHYTGRGWEHDGDARQEAFAAQESRQAPQWPQRRPVLQHVRTARPTTLLPAAGEAQAVSIPYSVQQRTPTDLVALWSEVGAVDRYQVLSSVAVVDPSTLSVEEVAALQDQLDGSPLELERHLELPASVSARTRRLAEDVTAGLETPWQKAAAIESYLRTTYPYDLDVPAPPADADVAEFFLFELQRGYCDYYATSFVVLARSVGVPTRFATGYLPGLWLPEQQEWLITEAEAHSWPEVYVDGLGWIPYEPTAGRAPLARPLGPLAENDGRPTPGLSTDSGVEKDPAELGRFPILLLFLVGIGASVGTWWLLRRGRNVEPWVGLVAWGRRLGRPQAVWETEREYSRAWPHS